jgi:indole-3-glycerol phosphate synthase
VRFEGPRLDDALARRAGHYVKVIAEVKRRSPSKGWLDEHLDAASLAGDYVRGGAAAISVLTDEPHFAGSRADLETVARTVAVPVLRKDFTVSENDVLDTAEMGASGVLLMSSPATSPWPSTSDSAHSSRCTTPTRSPSPSTVAPR